MSSLKGLSLELDFPPHHYLRTLSEVTFMKGRLDEERFRSWITSLLIKLLSHYGCFFSIHGTLNSDGRKLLEDIVRPLLRRRPELKGVVTKVRKEPTIDHVIRLAEEFMSREEATGLVRKGIEEEVCDSRE